MSEQKIKFTEEQKLKFTGEVYKLFRRIGFFGGGIVAEAEIETLLQNLLTEAKEGFLVGVEDGEYYTRSEQEQERPANLTPPPPGAVGF